MFQKYPPTPGKDKEKNGRGKGGRFDGQERGEREGGYTRLPGAIEEKRERAPVLRDYSSEKRAACEYRSDKGHGKKRKGVSTSRTAREAREEIPLSRGRATGISKIGENARGDVRVSLRFAQVYRGETLLATYSRARRL